MVKRLDAGEAQREFERVLREGLRDNDTFIAESNGQPIAAVVPVRILEAWEQKRQAFFDDMRTTAERVNLAEEEAQVIIEEAIKAVRAESGRKARPRDA